VDHLGRIVGYHAWAVLRLIDRCLELTPEQLELSTPGTYGSIHATLAHLVRSDGWFLSGALGEELGPPPQGPPPSLAFLRAEAERQAGRWRELLDREGAAEMAPAVGSFLTQAIHHGAEHRTHVCSVLGAHGLEVPDVSGWAYVSS
jgi:uncharacterized damage-inducible protein DinB